MIPNNEITLIIHGPISLFTILNLYRFRAEYSMIFVIPKPKTEQEVILLKELQSLANVTKYDASVIVYEPIVPENCDNKQNRYLHFFSVRLGLDLCKTMYAIKIRSDEFYSTLTVFIQEMNRYKNKIIMNDVYFRKANVLPIHPSDHLLGANTQILRDVFGLAKDYCLNSKELNNNPLAKVVLNKSPNGEFITAEQILGIASLSVLHSNMTNKLNEIDMVRESFEIVSSDRLGFFRVKTNTGNNKEYFDTSYFEENSDIRDIRDYKYD